MTNLRLVRPFTPTEQKIGQGIVAGLSYRDMAAELQHVNGDGAIQPRTVRAHVMTMAQKIIGLEDMPPRWAVYAYFKFVEWKDQRVTWPRDR